jgi:hypothetical protein
MAGRIVVIVNKKWEAAPILGAFNAPYSSTGASSRPVNWNANSPYPSVTMWPDPDDANKFPLRYLLTMGDMRVEVWCLADFEDTSDSIKKSGYIPEIVQTQPELPSLIVAVGTATSFSTGLQGSVVVGCRAFMHDANPTVPPIASRPSSWPASQIGALLESSFSSSLAGLMVGKFPSWMTDAQRRMLLARNGGSQPQILIDPKYVAVGDVNVTNYQQYPISDPQALAACLAADPNATIGSIETTSALIRSLVEPASFLFISGIVNDMGQLSRDVNPTEYAQNFVGAHNAGIVLAALLPMIVTS